MRIRPTQTVLAFAVAASFTLAGSALATDTEALTQEARQLSQTFAKSLKGALKPAMKQGGPVNAIQVCNEQAPEIATALNAKSDWQIGRTSLKTRNPDNAPDTWESTVLASFEKQRLSGIKPKDLEYSEIVNVDGVPTFRYMKAIGTGKLCLNCHGSNLSAEVVSSLDKHYPQDNARGFDKGDIRGAFTLSKSLR